MEMLLLYLLIGVGSGLVAGLASNLVAGRYWPARARLIAWIVGIAVTLASFPVVHAAFWPGMERQRLVGLFLELPPGRAIAEASPTEFNTLIDQMLAGERAHLPARTIMQRAMTRLLTIQARFLDGADAPHTVALIRAQQEGLIIVRRTSEERCGAMVAGQFVRGSTDLVGPELAQRMMETHAAAVRQGAAHPHAWGPPMTEDEFQPITDGAYARVPQARQGEVMAWFDQGRPDNNLVVRCVWTIAMLEHLLTLPPEEGARAFHSM